MTLSYICSSPDRPNTTDDRIIAGCVENGREDEFGNLVHQRIVVVHLSSASILTLKNCCRHLFSPLIITVSTLISDIPGGFIAIFYVGRDLEELVLWVGGVPLRSLYCGCMMSHGAFLWWGVLCCPVSLVSASCCRCCSSSRHVHKTMFNLIPLKPDDCIVRVVASCHATAINTRVKVASFTSERRHTRAVFETFQREIYKNAPIYKSLFHVIHGRQRGWCQPEQARLNM